MSDKRNELFGNRAARNTARAALDSGLARVKADLAARGVGGRVADQLTAEAKVTALHGLDIAKESKGIIAGTTVALALWFMRGPIITWLDKLLGEDAPADNEDASND